MNSYGFRPVMSKVLATGHSLALGGDLILERENILWGERAADWLAKKADETKAVVLFGTLGFALALAALVAIAIIGVITLVLAVCTQMVVEGFSWWYGRDFSASPEGDYPGEMPRGEAGFAYEEIISTPTEVENIEWAGNNPTEEEKRGMNGYILKAIERRWGANWREGVIAVAAQKPAEPESPASPEEYDALSIEELVALARSRGVKGITKRWKRQTIVKAIQGKQGS